MDKTLNFIARAKEIHGTRYDYSKVEYVHSAQKVIVVCTTHGEFLVTPNNHLSSKQGCQKCSKRHRPSLEEFINESHKIHRGAYNYSGTVYVNNHTPVSIECPAHGAFSVQPKDHLHKKSGCPMCGNASKGSYHKKDTTWFITAATAIHGGRYDYSNVRYHRYHDKVEILCPDHGPFFQTTGSHIHNQNGCPTCSIRDYEGGYGMKRFENHPSLRTTPGMLYLIRVYDDTEDFIKIGITQKTIHERFVVNNRLPYKYDVLQTVSGHLYDMFLLEQEAKRSLKRYRYHPRIKFSGHTECFSVEVRELLEKSIFK